MSQPLARRVFLSHASADKPDVQKLREALTDRGVACWEDILQLRLGDGVAALGAIRAADGFVLLLTPASIGSDGVQREVEQALEAKAERPGYVLLPILRGLQRPALRLLFGKADLVSVLLADDAPIQDAVAPIVQALGLAPADATPRPDPEPATPMAELLVSFESPRTDETGGTRRAAAQLRVRYTPATGGRGIDGRAASFVAPLGPIEAGDLRWYLEAYSLWPFGRFKERATAIEAQLPVWGRSLFDAILGRPESRAAFEAWRKAGAVERRITLLVDDRGTGDAAAAASLLALPWELLHDETGYLFEGALGARVRRTLPSEDALPPAEPKLPLRILLVLARPEDESAGFIDPRESAIPLAEALDPLGDAVALTVLRDGTFKALRKALDAASAAGKPFQVVHFDGHGVYDEKAGLGRLQFEDEDDAAQGKLERRAKSIAASDIGGLLRERRVPLFVLEACQTAMTEKSPTASVAAELLRVGVASVVAMSHSVLVETAKRFVGAFYRALAEGNRIGTAMVKAQQALKDDRARGERDDRRLEMADWMVPVLFQEDADARLFPGGVDLRPAAVEDRKLRARVLQGELPAPPRHGFVGRARALLALDRMLARDPLVALVGGGGQGKTELAKEAARWLLAMRRVDRVAFVSVEQVSDARGVLDAIGRQLVPGYAVAREEGSGNDDEKREKALLPVLGELQRRRVVIVVDNLESVLARPGEEMEEGTAEVLDLVKRLREAGSTRVLLTSREAPPEGLRARVFEVPALGRREGMELLAEVLREKGMSPPQGEDDAEAAEALVDEVGGHARSLVLLGALVAEKGVQAVAGNVRGMMRELEARWPDQRERSLIASVKLSLARLPEGVREKIRGLAVFHGVAHVGAMAPVLKMKPEEAQRICTMLVGVGLADLDGHYLLMDPGLGAALAGDLRGEEREGAERRWLLAMGGLVDFLYRQSDQDAKVARHGSRVALGDLMAGLAMLVGEVEAGRVEIAGAIDYATSLEALVAELGLPRVMVRVGEMRRALMQRLPAWDHARFIAEAADVDRKQDAGDVVGALSAARGLRGRAETAGDAYPETAYDRALAWLKLGRVLGAAGRSEEALPILEQAQERFSKLAASGSRDAAAMEGAAVLERANALSTLGRLDEAAAAYEDCIQRANSVGATRRVAVARNQLGALRFDQGRLADALTAHQAAQATFAALREPRSVAATWHSIGMVHAKAKNFKAAERAYKMSLSMKAEYGNRAGEAGTLHQLAGLYEAQGRLEDAAALLQQSIEVKHALGDPLDEATSLANRGAILHKLQRLDEARKALTAAVTLMKPHGHDAQPWKAWALLEAVERDARHPEAAAKARGEALRTYRAYRADGGEPMDGATRLIVTFRRTLRSAGPDAALALLPDAASVSADFVPALRALRALAGGDRDPALAADPDLYPTNAVELALLLESLAAPSPPP